MTEIEKIEKRHIHVIQKIFKCKKVGKLERELEYIFRRSCFESHYKFINKSINKYSDNKTYENYGEAK